MSVVLWHFFHEIFVSSTWVHGSLIRRVISRLSETPLYVTFAGHEAVILFFVLSGFVLTMLLERNTLSYPAYAIKRAARLYLPFITVVGLCVLLVSIVPLRIASGLVGWAQTLWTARPDLPSIWHHVLFIDAYDTRRFDFVVWSLVHEMRISLFFPFILALIVRVRAAVALLIFFLSSLTAEVLLANGRFGGFSTERSFLLTVHYTLFFAVGAILAVRRKSIADWYSRSSRRRHWLLGVLGLLLYAYGLRAVSGILILFPNLHIDGQIVSDWFVGAGSAIAVMLFLASPTLSRAVQYRPIAFLGRISYSLYLVHPVVLLVLLHVVYQGHYLGWIMMAGAILSVGAAALTYVAIERPAIALGRSLALRAQVHPQSEPLN